MAGREDVEQSITIRVDLTGPEASRGLPAVQAAVLAFGRTLLVDDTHLEGVVAELCKGVGARSVIVELFGEDAGGSATAGDAAREADEHWIPVTVEGSWVGTVSMRFDHPLGPGDLWILEAVADLVEAWATRLRVSHRLARSMAEKDRIVATVSHEIRTPLTAVLGLAEELRDRGHVMEPGELRELLGIVADQAREVTEIVDDLLVAARGDRVASAVAPVASRLDELVRSTVASVPTTARSGLVMRRVEPVEAMCDPLRTRQIVRNLIVNAHRHGGPHTAIDVFTIPQGDAVIRVADDGDPIPDEMQARMFDAYSGADRTDGPLPSVGLGLTVCRQLAREMGGDIFYRWDGESRFDVHLPRPAAGGPGTG